MKRVLCTAALLFAVTLMVTGQNYTLQVATGNYADLTGSTDVNQGIVWDDPELVVPIGFSFPFLGSTFDYLTVEDGVVSFRYNPDTLLIAYGADLIDRGFITGTSVSPISYVLETVSGMQVFKLEWKNFGFYAEVDTFGTLDWYGNAQLWLYENGVMEVHIGPWSIAEPQVAFFGSDGPYMGFGTPMWLTWLEGPITAPTMQSGSVFTLQSLDAIPADGAIYRILPQGINVPTVLKAAEFTLHPNPVVDRVEIELSVSGTLEVIDLTGKKLLSDHPLTEGRHTVDLSSLAPGFYMVIYTSRDGERATKRIVKE